MNSMDSLREKFRLIVRPFLLTAIGFIIMYSMLNYWLFIELNLFSLQEVIPNFLLPFLFAWIPVSIWVRPKLKLLRYNKKSDLYAYMLLSSFALAAPTAVAQEYLATATGQLTQLENIDQLPKLKPTRYYSIKHYFPDKQHEGVFSTATISGRYKNRLNYGIYFVVPVFKSAADSAAVQCSFFIGRKYKKTIRTGLSRPVKDAVFQEFFKSSQENFDTTDIYRYSYYQKSGRTNDHSNFEEAAKQTGYVSYYERFILIPQPGSFEERSGDSFAWLVFALVISCLALFILVLIPPFRETESMRIKNYWLSR